MATLSKYPYMALKDIAYIGSYEPVITSVSAQSTECTYVEIEVQLG